MQNIVLLGPPGSGKGTMSKELERMYGYQTFSTGDMLRAEARTGSPLGKEIDPLISNGSFVPDNIMIELMKTRIPTESFILDGFPRTLPQTEPFDSMMAERNTSFIVIYLEVDEDKLVERITKRRVCPKCGESYHLETKIPKEDGKCDFCEDATLEIRKDDNAELFANRLIDFKVKTLPIVEHYTRQNKVFTVDSNVTIAEQFAQIKAIVETL